MESIRNFIKKTLNIPTNWDKHDYKIQRYSFDDIEHVLLTYKENNELEAVIKKLNKMNTPTHKQLKAFLETTTATLDLTEFSTCIAYLECPEGSRIASIDYLNSKDVCDTEIYIGEDKYTLTEKQQENVLNHLEREINDDYNTWQEMKADTYNVRDDKY